MGDNPKNRNSPGEKDPGLTAEGLGNGAEDADGIGPPTDPKQESKPVPEAAAASAQDTAAATSRQPVAAAKAADSSVAQSGPPQPIEPSKPVHRPGTKPKRRPFDIAGVTFGLVILLGSVACLLWIARAGPFQVQPLEDRTTGIPTDRIWADLFYTCPKSTRVQLRMDVDALSPQYITTFMNVIVANGAEAKVADANIGQSAQVENPVFWRDALDNQGATFDVAAARACEQFVLSVALPVGVEPNPPFDREKRELGPTWEKAEKTDGPMQIWYLNFSEENKETIISYRGLVLGPTHWAARPMSFSKDLIVVDLYSHAAGITQGRWDEVPHVGIELARMPDVEGVRMEAQPILTRYYPYQTTSLFLGKDAMHTTIILQDPRKKGIEDILVVLLTALIGASAGGIYQALGNLISPPRALDDQRGQTP